MALQDFLSQMGYGGQTPPSVSRGRNADYTGLYGDQRLAAFLRDQSQTGFLSPSSVNPQVAQLVEGGVASEQFRQQNLARSLAAAGVNPAIAEKIIAEDQGRSMADITSKVAGFEGERQAREFQAGEDFIGFQSQIESEITSRAEDARRYRQQMREAKKARNMQMLSTLIGAAVQIGTAGAAGPAGFAGTLFGQMMGSSGGGKPGQGAEGQTGYQNMNQHGGGEGPPEPGNLSIPPGGGGGGQSYPGGPSFGALFGQAPMTPNYGGAYGQPGPSTNLMQQPYTQSYQGFNSQTPFGSMYPNWMQQRQPRPFGY